MKKEPAKKNKNIVSTSTTTTINGIHSINSVSSSVGNVILNNDIVWADNFSVGSLTTSNYYDSFVNIPNQNELLIDIAKKTVKLFDFTNESKLYVLKKFKTVLIKNVEYDAISIERYFEPGELMKFKKSQEKEIFIDFSDSNENDRYGEEYIFRTLLYDFQFSKIKNVIPLTIAQDLIAVTPMSSSTNNLFFMDYNYNLTGTNTNENNAINSINTKNNY